MPGSFELSDESTQAVAGRLYAGQFRVCGIAHEVYELALSAAAAQRGDDVQYMDRHRERLATWGGTSAIRFVREKILQLIFVKPVDEASFFQRLTT